MFGCAEEADGMDEDAVGESVMTHKKGEGDGELIVWNTAIPNKILQCRMCVNVLLMAGARRQLLELFKHGCMCLLLNGDSVNLFGIHVSSATHWDAHMLSGADKHGRSVIRFVAEEFHVVVLVQLMGDFGL